MRTVRWRQRKVSFSRGWPKPCPHPPMVRCGIGRSVVAATVGGAPGSRVLLQRVLDHKRGIAHGNEENWHATQHTDSPLRPSPVCVRRPGSVCVPCGGRILSLQNIPNRSATMKLAPILLAFVVGWPTTGYDAASPALVT